MAETFLAILPITGMDCKICATAVERNIKKVPGVDQVNVNLTTERVTFEYDSDSAKILGVIEKINRAGYGIAAGEAEFLARGLSDELDGPRLENILSKKDGLTSIYVNWISGKVILKYIPTILSQTDIRNMLTENCFEAVVISGEVEDIETIAWQEEIRRQRVDLIIGLVFTLPLFSLSMARDFSLLGSWAHQPCVNWLMAGLATPVQFHVGRKYFTGAIQSLRNRFANVDVLVALGSTAAYLYSIPVLLGLVSGHLHFETAAIIIALIKAGESLPAEKSVGVEVVGGTVNKQSVLKFEAKKVGKDTALAQIIRLVEEAQGSKAPIQRIADQVSAIFVPAVVLSAGLTFLVWLFLVKTMPDPGTSQFARAMLNAEAVLLISCPCTMGLATPTAVMVGFGRGPQNGILYTSGGSLERACSIPTVVLDKTGTITNGKPVLTNLLVVNQSDYN